MAKAPGGTVCVRLWRPKRCGSGLAYSVEYVADASPMDERIETPGGILFVDSGSLLYLIGSTMDWREDDFTTGFVFDNPNAKRSEEHTSELQSLMRISYAVFCLKKKIQNTHKNKKEDHSRKRHKKTQYHKN